MRQSEKHLIFPKPSKLLILIFWNLILFTFLCTKIKKTYHSQYFFFWCMFRTHVSQMRTSHLTELNEKALLKAIEIEGWPQALCRQSVFARFYCSCSLSLHLAATWMDERKRATRWLKSPKRSCWPSPPSLQQMRRKAYDKKHCQRHNGPEGWVHITSSNKNLDQISSSESRPRINFKISTKHQPLHKT